MHVCLNYVSTVYSSALNEKANIRKHASLGDCQGARFGGGGGVGNVEAKNLIE